MAEIDDLDIADASNTARFPENMAPSAVNDGARALEGLLARWHEDTNGSVASTGSANAYLFAAKQTLAAYYDGLTITFDANFGNTGAATLDVDSVSADAIIWPDGAALTSGDIPSGGKITVRHDGTSWQLVSTTAGPTAGATKEFFVSAVSAGGDGITYPITTLVGDFATDGVGSNDEMYFLFHIPNDFASLTDAVVVVLPDASETIQWDALTDFGAAGEAPTANSDSDVDATLAVTVDIIAECDVSPALTGLAAGDYVGLQFASDTDSIRPIVLRIRYT